MGVFSSVLASRTASFSISVTTDYNVANVHQEIAEMVPAERPMLRLPAGLTFHLVMTNAPENVVPSVAFLKIGVPGVDQLLGKRRVGELLNEKFPHDDDLDSVPVVAQVEVLTDSLGLSGCQVRIELKRKNRALLGV